MFKVRICSLPRSFVEPFDENKDELETIRKLVGLEVPTVPTVHGTVPFRAGYVVINLSECIKFMEGVPDSVKRKWTNMYTMYLVYFPLSYTDLGD